MNSTKILVLRQKHLVLIMIAIVLSILLLVLAVNGVFSNNEGTTTEPSKTTVSSDKSTYKPGVYTASVIVNGSPMDVRLTVDDNNINDIELLNVSDTITTMYPLIETSFEDIKKQVIDNNGTAGINFSTENTYSTTTLLNAINIVLEKAKR